jgi:hypothetical protein
MEKAEQLVPKSIVVQGINNTAVSVDYVCFIVFGRSVKINMLDGSLLRE